MYSETENNIFTYVVLKAGPTFSVSDMILGHIMWLGFKLQPGPGIFSATYLYTGFLPVHRLSAFQQVPRRIANNIKET